MGAQIGPQVAGCLEITRLVGVMPESTLHVPGTGFGNPGHQVRGLARVIENFRNHILQIFDFIFCAGAVFALNFFLGPVIIFLHKHKNGAYGCDSGRNKSGRKIETAGHPQAGRKYQGKFYFSGRLNLIGKIEIIQTVSSDFNCCI